MVGIILAARLGGMSHLRRGGYVGSRPGHMALWTVDHSSAIWLACGLADGCVPQGQGPGAGELTADLIFASSLRSCDCPSHIAARIKAGGRPLAAGHDGCGAPFGFGLSKGGGVDFAFLLDRRVAGPYPLAMTGVPRPWGLVYQGCGR